MTDAEKPMLSKTELAALDLLIAQSEEEGRLVTNDVLMGAARRMVVEQARRNVIYTVRKLEARVTSQPAFEEERRPLSQRVRDHLSDDLTLEDLIQIRALVTKGEE